MLARTSASSVVRPLKEVTSSVDQRTHVTVAATLKVSQRRNLSTASAERPNVRASKRVRLKLDVPPLRNLVAIRDRGVPRVRIVLAYAAFDATEVGELRVVRSVEDTYGVETSTDAESLDRPASTHSESQLSVLHRSDAGTCGQRVRGMRELPSRGSYDFDGAAKFANLSANLLKFFRCARASATAGSSLPVAKASTWLMPPLRMSVASSAF